jgi:glycosyltransferase involved in cell wall biosynthesis
MTKKILFFIESLQAGGKERRLIELLFYLKNNTDYSIHLALTSDVIHYSYISDLNIPTTIMKRGVLKKDPSIFFKFHSLSKKIQPDIIHTWGVMTTFYAIPSKLILRKPLISNLIANSEMKFRRFSLSHLFFKSGCAFSDRVLSNSNAGLKAYKFNSPKAHLIYNGIRLERFQLDVNIEEIRAQLGVDTKYLIIMVASMSKNKDYDLLLDVAKEIGKINNEISFISVGDGTEIFRIRERIEAEGISNLKILGHRNDVESLIKISDIGLLFSPSEGISNAIMEYMALGKPVITTDEKGGSKELIENGKSGYILAGDLNLIVSKINDLVQNDGMRKTFGDRGKAIIDEKFSIGKMGKKFSNLYREILLQE